MKVKSFYRDGLKLQLMIVELTLVSGLPQMKMLGLPDSVSRESIDRIRVALKSQGFKWPKAQQIIVQLHPLHIKKSCRGLDLAIAAAYLWETGQAPLPDGEPTLYGELNLSGEVLTPPDLSEVQGVENVWTGPLGGAQTFDVRSLKRLKEIHQPEFIFRRPRETKWQRPSLSNLSLSPPLAKVLAVAAAGEHSLFLAGPAGSGKTTSARILHSLLKDPDEKQFEESKQIARYFNDELVWRPLAQPHHTTPTVSMVGGAKPLEPGEITRAHGGVLFLDEFLEFKPVVREALREPVEMGKITVSRIGERAEFPANFLLIATSNLCKCGRFRPEDDSGCFCPEKRRRSYLERLSGPVLDRFSILHFSRPWVREESTVEISEVQSLVQKAQGFALQSRNQMISNSKVDLQLFIKTFDSFVRDSLMPQTFESARRFQSVVRVARTLADIDESTQIKGVHANEACEFAVNSFAKLHQSRDVDRLRQFR